MNQRTNRKKKGAIIGFGFISGKGHFPAYAERSDVEIVAIADICGARREAAGRAVQSTPFSGLRIYDSADALLQTEQDLDFVDISTPPCDHFAIAMAALQKGLHVLCEKPLTTTLDQANRLVDAAAKHRRVVFPCHNYKHAPVVKTVDEILASGEIGPARGLTLSTFRPTHAKGVQEWTTDWRRDRKFSGGGIAMDHGSHTFYLTFHWMRSYPTAVTAKMSTTPGLNTEDNYSCVLTFPNGYAHAHLTWTAGVRKVIYTIQGTKGAITIDDDDVQVARVAGGGRRFSIASHWADASHVQWFNSMFDQFLGCMERADFQNRDLLEAQHCIQIIERSYASAADGCREAQLWVPEGLSASLFSK